MHDSFVQLDEANPKVFNVNSGNLLIDKIV